MCVHVKLIKMYVENYHISYACIYSNLLFPHIPYNNNKDISDLTSAISPQFF